jgi:hypothetical protein
MELLRVLENTNSFLVSSKKIQETETTGSIEKKGS